MLALDLLGVSTVDRASDAAKTVGAEVAAVSKRVSPWLWILSVGGFSMAILNRYQIANATGGNMFGSFTKLRSMLRTKKAAQ